MAEGGDGPRTHQYTGRVPVTAALVLVTGLGPWATDTYVAGLPELRTSLGTTAAIAQLTLTAFIIGTALGQLVLGPVSDGRGRRSLLYGSATLFIAASLLCAVAPTGWALVAARFIQGLASGGGVAIGRAVVGDVYRGAEAAKRYGTLASIIFLGPVLAPVIGALILRIGSWRTIFALLAVVGVVMLVAIRLGIPETLPVGARHSTGARQTLASMSDLFRDWHFMQHVSVQCLATAGFFTYIGGSSFVLETVYGVSQSAYAAIFAVNAATMALASLVFRQVVPRTGPTLLRTVGLSIATVAALGLVVAGVVGRHALPPLYVPWALLCCVTAAMGLVLPATTTLAQEAGRRSRGTAAALQGGLSFLVGALVTPLTGFLGYTSLLPMALLMAGFFLAASALRFRTAHTGGDGVGVPSAASAASISSRLIPKR
jgi:DHA1 family bicyclomycin/chloramphenicol resistance-like MFS transporter